MCMCQCVLHRIQRDPVIKFKKKKFGTKKQDFTAKI